MNFRFVSFGPTDTHQDLVSWVEADVKTFKQELAGIYQQIKQVAKQIVDAGGPYVEGVI
jgi:hypothetical protein